LIFGPLGFETNYLEKQWLSKNIFRRGNELRNLKQTAEVNFGYLVQKKKKGNHFFFDDLILFRSELVNKKVECHNSKKIFGRLYF
jgi:hypothetical protein